MRACHGQASRSSRKSRRAPMAGAEVDEPLSAGEDPAEKSRLRPGEAAKAPAWHIPWRMRALFVVLTVAVLVAMLVAVLAPAWWLRRDSAPRVSDSSGTLVEVMSNVASGTVYLDGGKVSTRLPVLLTLRP